MKTDWVGMWFRLLEKRGFQTNVILGSFDENDVIQFKEYSHAEFDGIGVILHSLRSSGFAPPVPELAAKFRSTFFAKLIGLIRNLRFVPVFGAEWRNQGQSVNVKKFSYRILGTEESQKVIDMAKSRGVSVNSLSMWALDLVLRPEWIESSGPFYWMIPVNMRGAAKKKIDTSNHASWIWVDTKKINDPKQIQMQIEQRLNEDFHWGAWFGLNIGKWIGQKGMNFLLDQAEDINEHWVGTFSNVGTWKIPAKPLVIVIPTAPSTPLSAGCVTVGGRIALSLHIHPTLKIEEHKLEQFLDTWVKNIIS